MKELLEKQSKNADVAKDMASNVGGYNGIRVNNAGGYGLGKNGFGIGINSSSTISSSN